MLSPLFTWARSPMARRTEATTIGFWSPPRSFGIKTCRQGGYWSGKKCPCHRFIQVLPFLQTFLTTSFVLFLFLSVFVTFFTSTFLSPFHFLPPINKLPNDLQLSPTLLFNSLAVTPDCWNLDVIRYNLEIFADNYHIFATNFIMSYKDN